MRNQFVFYGLSIGLISAAWKEASDGLAPVDESELVAFASECWQRPEREWQHAAIRGLRAHFGLLTADSLPHLERLITTKSWWDTVDELATHVVGDVVKAHPELVAVMDEWIGSPNIWLTRTAILHQERWKARTDPERLFRYCLLRAGEKEFFIRKAIGWALRSYSGIDPEAVARFLEENDGRLSGLSKREAMRGVERARARLRG